VDELVAECDDLGASRSETVEAIACEDFYDTLNTPVIPRI